MHTGIRVLHETSLFVFFAGVSRCNLSGLLKSRDAICAPRMYGDHEEIVGVPQELLEDNFV